MPLMHHKNFRVLLFDLESNGHHASYINHLLTLYFDTQPSFELFLVVSPDFITKHHEIIHEFKLNNKEAGCLQIISISKTELLAINNAMILPKKIICIWKILKRYAENLNIDHCIVMWFDHLLQFPLSLHFSFPCAISGICFRPMFHYLHWQDKIMPFSHRVKAWRQKILYYWAVRHPKLHTLFCLDPFVPESINKLSRHPKALYLPDPVASYRGSIDQQVLNHLKHSLGIEPERKIFLFFGAIAARKGIYKILEALKLLDDATSQKSTLLLVGEIVHTEDIEPITQAIEKLKTHSAVEIVFHNQFVTDIEMHHYFSLTDVVLAPYLKHVGMSGILLQAAAAGKPVISSNYGLMGQMIDTYSLGLAVDTELPAAIAGAIQETFSDTFKALYDQEKMQQWVAQNSPDMFSRTIFDQIIKPNA